MRKKFHQRQLNQDAVPTTSLADMMFLLLIFFIMTTTLAKTTGFVTDIPSGTKGQANTQDKTPTVVLHDDKITVNDTQSMDMAQLRQYIAGLRLDQRQGEDKVVIVSAEGRVPYQTYYETLAMVQNAGGMVAIVTEEEEKK
jgi:biopolymer transport protein ExbD